MCTYRRLSQRMLCGCGSSWPNAFCLRAAGVFGGWCWVAQPLLAVESWSHLCVSGSWLGAPVHVLPCASVSSHVCFMHVTEAALLIGSRALTCTALPTAPPSGCSSSFCLLILKNSTCQAQPAPGIFVSYCYVFIVPVSVSLPPFLLPSFLPSVFVSGPSASGKEAQ